MPVTLAFAFSKEVCTTFRIVMGRGGFNLSFCEIAKLCFLSSRQPEIVPQAERFTINLQRPETNICSHNPHAASFAYEFELFGAARCALSKQQKPTSAAPSRISCCKPTQQM